MAIIKSILDTDLYKLTMSQAYFLNYKTAVGSYKFYDRKHEHFGETYLNIIRSEINNLTSLKLEEDEADYLLSLGFFKTEYVEELARFRFDPTKVEATLNDKGELQLIITDTIYKATLYEVPLLAIISEVRNRYLGFIPSEKAYMEKYAAKQYMASEDGVIFSEFGTRRRVSSDIHEAVVKHIASTINTCTGTSNVYFAMKYKLKPNGTMAHEMFMFHAALVGYKMANCATLDMWYGLYGDHLATALVDTFTTKAFLDTLTKEQCEEYAGYRIDSGDEYLIGDTIIEKFMELGVDPKKKTLVFSNALDFEKARKIRDYFNGKVGKVVFGIGTNITCDVDVDDFTAPSIVIKLDACAPDGDTPLISVVKISDDIDKHCGDEEAFKRAMAEIGAVKRNQPSYTKKGEFLGWFSRSCAASVVVIAYDKTGAKRVLAAKRGEKALHYNGFYNLPSGYLDFDETIAECASRELFEECGVQVQPEKLILFKHDDNPSSHLQNITFYFKTEIRYASCEDITTTTEHSEEKEVEDIVWVSIDDVDKYTWAFGHGNIIKEILNH